MERPTRRSKLRNLLHAAFENLSADAGKGRITVAALCNEARIGRSVLYSSYPELLREMKARIQSRSPGMPRGEIIAIRRRNVELVALNRSLAAQCVELKLALNMALDKLDELSLLRRRSR